MKDRIGWFKDTAKTLWLLEFFKPALKSMQHELPHFWKGLTFKQKLQVSALLPVVTAALSVGNIGVAALGGAVGIPVAVLVLIFLFLSNGLIEALDFILDIFPKLKKKDFSYEEAENIFENFLKTFLHETFKTKFDGRVEEVTAAVFAFSGDNARDCQLPPAQGWWLVAASRCRVLSSNPSGSRTVCPPDFRT